MNVADNALEFWLSSLNMSCYYQTFIDNGYDDLEISKKVCWKLIFCFAYYSTIWQTKIQQMVILI